MLRVTSHLSTYHSDLITCRDLQKLCLFGRSSAKPKVTVTTFQQCPPTGSRQRDRRRREKSIVHSSAARSRRCSSKITWRAPHQY